MKQMYIFLVLIFAIGKSHCYECETNWHLFEDICYNVYFSNANFQSAEQRCLNVGAELVSVRSQEQFLFLRKITQNSVSSMTSFWLGGRRNETNRNLFRWTDGSVWDYSAWGGGQPGTSNSYDCVYMNTHMAVTTCGNTLYQLCQKRAIAQRRFTVELDLNETVHRINEVAKSVKATEERYNKSVEELSRSFQNSLQPISEQIRSIKKNNRVTEEETNKKLSLFNDVLKSQITKISNIEQRVNVSRDEFLKNQVPEASKSEVKQIEEKFKKLVEASELIETTFNIVKKSDRLTERVRIIIIV
ncbi:ladderlectin-like protein [Leptotrombidium deliense]|uniref:Ladderlectin-like protein n=1 Tax=Leptotrombidium deliense TaxID=299467 RepID=A0A443S071_9ACAR|nr:ladderlectin-like protein [Leptotrombidium deliense]